MCSRGPPTAPNNQLLMLPNPTNAQALLNNLLRDAWAASKASTSADTKAASAEVLAVARTAGGVSAEICGLRRDKLILLRHAQWRGG